MTSSHNSQILWNQIVADFRQACVLRREGSEVEAARLINEKLPPAIAAWSREDMRSTAEKKQALESMFATEQTSVDSWRCAYQVLAVELAERLIPALCQGVSREFKTALGEQIQALQEAVQAAASKGPAVREKRQDRVRFDDVPRVIDALLTAQTADYGARPALAL